MSGDKCDICLRNPCTCNQDSDTWQEAYRKRCFDIKSDNTPVKGFWFKAGFESRNNEIDDELIESTIDALQAKVEELKEEIEAYYDPRMEKLEAQLKSAREVILYAHGAYNIKSMREYCKEWLKENKGE